MKATAFTSRATAAFVAAVAGFASYQHIYRVATTAGEHQSVSAVLPLSIDGLILVATLAMLEDKRNRRRPRASARFALVFGIVATLAANVASAQPTITARLVAAVPALSFLLSVEVLARSGKPAPAIEAAVEHANITPAAEALTAIVDATAPATVATRDPATTPASDPPRVPAKRMPARAAATRQTSEQRVATAVAKKPAMTQTEAAKVLGLSERTVQRYWPKPAATVNGHDHSKEG
ncbi:DUF2637 domain-containing protein [Micromonospora sp. NPDC005113]